MLSLSCTYSHHRLQAIWLPCRHLAVRRQACCRSVAGGIGPLHCRGRALSVFMCTCLLDLQPSMLQKPAT